MPKSELVLLTSACVFHFALQLVFNLSIPDHVSDGFQSQLDLEEEPICLLDGVVRIALSGYARWDAQHYIFIAKHGYNRLERSAAFLPLLPVSLRGLALLLEIVSMKWLSSYSCLLLAGFLISNVSFVLAGLVLTLLTREVFRMNRKIAGATFMLYLFNPASIFFHATYTEATYSLFTWLGLLFHNRSGRDKLAILKSCLFFSLACLTRSNGLLNFGYPLHYIISSITLHFLDRKSTKLNWIAFMNALAPFLAVAPFFAFQYYSYTVLCSAHAGQEAGFCETFHLPYTMIQKKHWNVGFLEYYRWKLLPCFLLASPCIMLALMSCYFFWRSRRCTRLWFLLQNGTLAPHIIHVLLLTMYCTFFVNIEVTTRLIFSSSPLIFWFCATTFKRVPGIFDGPRTNLLALFQELFVRNGWQARLILIYFMLFVFIGTALHVNFYPWT